MFRGLPPFPLPPNPLSHKARPVGQSGVRPFGPSVFSGGAPPSSASLRPCAPRPPCPPPSVCVCVVCGGCVSVVGVGVSVVGVWSSVAWAASSALGALRALRFKCSLVRLPSPSSLAVACSSRAAGRALGPVAPPRPVLGSLRSLRFKRGRGGASLPSALAAARSSRLYVFLVCRF